MLQRVLRGRITFTPGDDGYRFSAETRFDQLFVGVPRPRWIPLGDARGTEHIAEADTLDLDYGRLLEKSMVALRGFEPRFDG